MPANATAFIMGPVSLTTQTAGDAPTRNIDNHIAMYHSILCRLPKTPEQDSIPWYFRAVTFPFSNFELLVAGFNGKPHART
jgi:hypothetical protein